MKKHLLLKDKKKMKKTSQSEKILIKRNNIMKKIEFNERRITSKIFPKTLILIIILLVIKFDNYLSKTFFKLSKKNENSKIKV
jgi:hypothetical protein